jgi:RNA polymerase sigma-70 factor (ECF subfamily)
VTEQQLIASAKDGDHSAFEALVKKYEAQVAATVVGMLGPCQASEDVGQEVFVRLYRSIRNFREGSTLGTYLSRIAINLSLNELKRRKRRSFLFVSGHDAERSKDLASDPEDTILRTEKQQLVHRALQTLEPNFRSVIILRLLRGYSTSETAAILNVPLGTVLSRLSRAQQKLKGVLLPYLEEKV